MDDFLGLLWPVVVVILIIAGAYLATKWVAKKQNTFSSGKIITVLERVMLGRDAFLAAVRVDRKIFLISVSGGKTEVLSELSEEILQNAQQEDSGKDFFSLFKTFLEPKAGGKTKKGWNKRDG